MFRNLGLTVAWQGATVDALRAIALEADRLGFGYLWIPEAWGVEALSTIAHLLTITTKIKIGSGILNVYSRSAALIGMACATLDQISPGRFALGLGSSGRELVENWHGVKFEKPLDRTREYIDVIRKVASGESVDYNGEILHLNRFRLFSKPMVSVPEIYLGAIGEKNLRLSGRVADGAILATFPISKLDYAESVVNEESGNKKIFAYYPLKIVDSEEGKQEARTEFAKNIAFYVSSMGSYYAKNLSNLGYADRVKKIRAAYSTGGSKAAVSAVEPEFVDDLSFIGSAKSIVEKVSQISKNVIPVFGLRASSIEATQEGIESLRVLAAEISN